jgi:hypothetical protein
MFPARDLFDCQGNLEPEGLLALGGRLNQAGQNVSFNIFYFSEY